ncbi:hypothetical protein P7C71_g3296, partial [Lecanoromycetidae sp. Uapishka_2]
MPDEDLFSCPYNVKPPIELVPYVCDKFDSLIHSRVKLNYQIIDFDSKYHGIKSHDRWRKCISCPIIIHDCNKYRIFIWKCHIICCPGHYLVYNRGNRDYHGVGPDSCDNFDWSILFNRYKHLYERYRHSKRYHFANDIAHNAHDYFNCINRYYTHPNGARYRFANDIPYTTHDCSNCISRHHGHRNSARNSYNDCCKHSNSIAWTVLSD